MKVRVFPDPILQKKAQRVSKVGEPEKKMLAEMAATMYLNNGVGLAAVQIGVDRQLAVIDIGEGLIKMVNPDIVKRAGSQMEEEGCLSMPGFCAKIKRARSVTVQFLNENGDMAQIRAEGLLSRAIQHEVDHLCGILILDHVNPVKKMLAKVRLKRRPGKLDKRRTI